MDKLIIYKKVGRKIGIIIPVEANRLGSQTRENFLEKLARKVVPANRPYLIINFDQLPDRDFREAWEWSGNKAPRLIINMKIAKKLWINKWRIARKPLLDKLDIEYFVAVENKDEESQNKIAQKKQELRDITKHDLSGVENIGQLKEIWPSTLRE